MTVAAASGLGAVPALTALLAAGRMPALAAAVTLGTLPGTAAVTALVAPGALATGASAGSSPSGRARSAHRPPRARPPSAAIRITQRILPDTARGCRITGSGGPKTCDGGCAGATYAGSDGGIDGGNGTETDPDVAGAGARGIGA